jgi:hypothetical protein
MSTEPDPQEPPRIREATPAEIVALVTPIAERLTVTVTGADSENHDPLDVQDLTAVVEMILDTAPGGLGRLTQVPYLSPAGVDFLRLAEHDLSGVDTPGLLAAAVVLHRALRRTITAAATAMHAPEPGVAR